MASRHGWKVEVSQQKMTLMPGEQIQWGKANEFAAHPLGPSELRACGTDVRPARRLRLEIR